MERCLYHWCGIALGFSDRRTNLVASGGRVAQTPECGRPRCTLHAFCKPEVAQVSNLLYRRLPVGRACELRSVGGLEIRDTADWKSALRGCVRQDACKVQGKPHALHTLARARYGRRYQNRPLQTVKPNKRLTF